MKKEKIAGLLPYVFARAATPGSVLDAVLLAMEKLHEPSEEVLSALDLFFDPLRCPDRFVPMLATWIGLADLLRTAAPGRAPTGLEAGSPQLRELVARGAELSRRRGTALGLVEFLQVATGVAGFRIEEGLDAAGHPREFHITVHAPAEAARHRRLVERAIDLEKPAHITCDIALPSGS
jgi:phage tail-like protein